MKILLTLIMCSYTQSVCLDPYAWPIPFTSTYDCMMAGYEEAMVKMKELGPKEVYELETLSQDNEKHYVFYKLEEEEILFLDVEGASAA